VVRLSTDGITQHQTARLPFTCSGALKTAMHDGNFVVVSKTVVPMHTLEDLEQDLLTLTPGSGLNPATTNGQQAPLLSVPIAQFDFPCPVIGVSRSLSC